jgi:hypothetical protein
MRARALPLLEICVRCVSASVRQGERDAATMTALALDPPPLSPAERRRLIAEARERLPELGRQLAAAWARWRGTDPLESRARAIATRELDRALAATIAAEARLVMLGDRASAVPRPWRRCIRPIAAPGAAPPTPWRGRASRKGSVPKPDTTRNGAPEPADESGPSAATRIASALDLHTVASGSAGTQGVRDASPSSGGAGASDRSDIVIREPSL